MTNIFVGFDMANRFKKIRDSLPGRTTDTEFMVILLNTWWDNNKEQIDGYTSGRDEFDRIGVQADMSERGSEVPQENGSDIPTDKKTVHRSSKKQTKGSTTRRSRDDRKSI